MRRFLDLLKNSAGLRQSIVLVGGSLFASLFTAVALIITSRHLGPTLFAEFTVGYSLMVIITRIQGLGLNVALQKITGPYFKQDNWQKEVSEIIQVSSRINTLIVVTSLLIGLVVSIPLASFLHFSSPSILFGSFLFASVIMVFEYGTAILQMLHRFSSSVAMLITQAAAKLGIAIIFQVTGIGSVSFLFYCFYAVPLISMTLFFKALPEGVQVLPPKHNLDIEQKLWRIMKHSIILVSTIGMIDYLDILLVQKFTTPFETGIYGGLAQLTTAVSLVGYSLAAVFDARVARYHNYKELTSFLKKSSVVVMAALTGFLVYLPLTQISINLTLGSQYIAGEPYLPILMASSFLLIATVPFAALFYSLDHPKYFSLCGLGQLLITVLGGLIFIPSFGLAGASWVKLATRVFLLVFTLGFAFYAMRQKRIKEEAITV